MSDNTAFVAVAALAAVVLLAVVGMIGANYVTKVREHAAICKAQPAVCIAEAKAR